jgi:hypothetical protein
LTFGLIFTHLVTYPFFFVILFFLWIWIYLIFISGVTFYEILTGSPPFPQAGDPRQMIYMHMTSYPKTPQEVTPLTLLYYYKLNNNPIKKVKPSVSKAVSDVIMKLLSKNAEDRYQGICPRLFVIFLFFYFCIFIFLQLILNRCMWIVVRLIGDT